MISEEQIKSYYERIEKLLNGANKETYGFAPEEIRQILRWYEVSQQENQSLKDRIEKGIEYIEKHYSMPTDSDLHLINKIDQRYLLEILKGDK